MKILKDDGGKYKVESSQKGKYYLVGLEEPSCTCPSFLFRLRKFHSPCKHILAVKDKVEKRDSEAYNSIIEFVKKNREVDSIALINKFGEQPVDDLLSRGELIEEKGVIRLMK